MEWIIREATLGDYDALCALFAQVDRVHYTALPDIFRPVPGPARDHSYIEKILSDETQRLYVAEHGNELIGLAEAALRNSSQWPMFTLRKWIHISDIVVDERFRDIGVGKALLTRVEQWARELGILRVELHVWEFNTSARALYEHQGFGMLNRTMSKDLDP